MSEQENRMVAVSLLLSDLVLLSSNWYIAYEQVPGFEPPGRYSLSIDGELVAFHEVTILDALLHGIEAWESVND